MDWGWVEELERDAPDVVGAWRGIEAGRLLTVRREVRRRARAGSSAVIVEQLEATAAALIAIVERLPEPAFALPGGEEDWTVAEAIGHDASARSGLALAASLAAAGRWSAGTPPVQTSVPGPSGLGRDELIAKLRQSGRLIARAARSIAGHETDPCPLEHPLVGRLRCGEWLLFAGVHDVMHLEQLHRIAAGLDERAAATEARPGPAAPLG